MRTCGTKQVLKALDSSKVEKVFIADDADEFLKNKIISACKDKGVKVERVKTKLELGRMCGIAVASATAADLSE